MTEGNAGRETWRATDWSAIEKYAQHLLICIFEFPGAAAGVEVVRINVCLTSHHITSQCGILTYPEQSVLISECSRAHFPHHLVVIFLRWAGRQPANPWWLRPGEGGFTARTGSSQTAGRARKSLECCFLLSCPAPVWHLADLSTRPTGLESSVECCQFVISTLPGYLTPPLHSTPALLSS